MKAVEIVKRFFNDEKGLETVEYAVMTTLIVAAAVAAIGALVLAMTGRFESVTGIVAP